MGGSMRTKNLLNGKPEGGFRRWRRGTFAPLALGAWLAAVLPSFGLAFAVFAAAGMAAAGCDNLTGVDNRYDEAASAEAAAEAGGSVTGGAGGITAFSAAAFKTINVKFEVLNGGLGLIKSCGIVSNQDDRYLVYDGAICANDFTVTIMVPASDEYLNVRWRGNDIGQDVVVRGKMKAESCTVEVDFKLIGYPDTKNLYDVRRGYVTLGDNKTEFYYDWEDAYGRAVHKGVYGSPGFPGTKKVNIKFEILNGGSGLFWSKALISTPDDSLVIGDLASCSNDFRMSIEPPDTVQYLNIRWLGAAAFDTFTVLRAKLNCADAGTVTKTVKIDYNGYKSLKTKNLYDVEVGGKSGSLMDDWDRTRTKALKDVY